MCRKQPGIGALIGAGAAGAARGWARVQEERAGVPSTIAHGHVRAAIGRLCAKCDGKCVVCDSYVHPAAKVRTCDECNYGSYQGRCVICGGMGISDAFYCRECVRQEKDRDGACVRGPGARLLRCFFSFIRGPRPTVGWECMSVLESCAVCACARGQGVPRL